MFYVTSLGFILAFIFYAPFRFYILSFGFPWLYEHPWVSCFFGIKYEDDMTFKTNRDETRIYLSGLFAYLFTKFTGMKIETSKETIKDMMRLQISHVKEITMKPYFKEIDNKRMNLDEFEDFLSRVFLLETNRVFKFLNETHEQYFLGQVKIIRTIVNGLTGGTKGALGTMIRNYGAVRNVKKILGELPEASRLLLLIPHLSMIDGFSKMLIRTKGDTSTLKAVDFFEQTSKFFVVVNKGSLMFIKRHADDTNNANNRTFGIIGSTGGQKWLCPGSGFVIKFVQSVLSLLQSMDIIVEGNAVISNNRFRNITNKKDVFVTFKTAREYVENNEVLVE